MAEQHRATDKQWALVRCMTHHTEYSTILELLHRIEALEAKDEDDIEAWAAMRRAGSSAAERIGALEKRIEALEATQQPQPNHPAKPDSSLVERVEDAIWISSIFKNGNETKFRSKARAAIREVAAWLQEKGYSLVPAKLELEIEQ